MRFDPELQEYVPENPLVDRTTAQIVGSRNPVARGDKIELGVEVASGARKLSSLSSSELQQLQDIDLGHTTNKMVISEKMARVPDPIETQVDTGSFEPSVDVGSTLAESDKTASEAFKSDFREKYRDEKRVDRQDDFRSSRRDERR